MNGFWTTFLPPAIVLSSLVPGLIIFSLREEQVRLRIALNLFAAGLKLVLLGLMLWGVNRGLDFRFAIDFLPGGGLVLQGDATSLQFVSLSAVLWLASPGASFMTGQTICPSGGAVML